MYISRFQVGNYKSIRESVPLELTKGFNIVSGQNNAGKTTLLEAMGLDFTAKPHRSLAATPFRDTPHSHTSFADVTIKSSIDEVKQLLSRFETDLQIARPDLGSEYALQVGYRDHSVASAENLVRSIFSEGLLTFKLRREATPPQAPSWSVPQVPSFGTYTPQVHNGNYVYLTFRIGRDGTPLGRKHR